MQPRLLIIWNELTNIKTCEEHLHWSDTNHSDTSLYSHRRVMPSAPKRQISGTWTYFTINSICFICISAMLSRTAVGRWLRARHDCGWLVPHHLYLWKATYFVSRLFSCARVCVKPDWWNANTLLKATECPFFRSGIRRSDTAALWFHALISFIV